MSRRINAFLADLASPGLARILRPPACALAPEPIPNALLEEVRALMTAGPGMTGASPTWLEFVTTSEARERLAQRLPSSERMRVLSAPVLVVLAYDRARAEQMLAFATDGLEAQGALEAAALRHSVLQGAYLALAARAVGLDVAFFPGFDVEALSEDLFQQRALEVNFVAALGYPASEVA